ncbi:hypothetical protein D3C74_433340 [compost metagenome]
MLNVLQTSYFHDVVMMRIENDFARELEERYGKDYALIRREHPERHSENLNTLISRKDDLL